MPIVPSLPKSGKYHNLFAKVPLPSLRRYRCLQPPFTVVVLSTSRSSRWDGWDSLTRCTPCQRMTRVGTAVYCSSRWPILLYLKLSVTRFEIVFQTTDSSACENDDKEGCAAAAAASKTTIGVSHVYRRRYLLEAICLFYKTAKNPRKPRKILETTENRTPVIQ